MKILKIYEDEDYDFSETIPGVIKQLKARYTSGVNPNWELVDEDTELTNADKDLLTKALLLLINSKHDTFDRTALFAKLGSDFR